MGPSENVAYLAWKQFVTWGKEHSHIRPEILSSWKRSQKYKVDPYQKLNAHVLDNRGLMGRVKACAELMQVAQPVMESIYRFVIGSGFVVALVDAEGYIIEVLGDSDMVKKTQDINAIPGSNWSEEVMGTNAIGTALVLEKPIQVFAYEHWCICTHVGTCSSAPIHDPETGKKIGALNMTGVEVHPHTLGIVVAAVEAIKNQIMARRVMERAWVADKMKTLIMESISEGLLAVDSIGCITHVNKRAAQLLQLDQSSVLGQKIEFVLNNRNNSLLRYMIGAENIRDELVTIESLPSERARVTMNTYQLESNGVVVGKLAVFQEISRFSQMAQRLGGFRAQFTFDDIIGQDEAFSSSVRAAIRAASSSSNVLLLGETGTGKDVFAQAIHNGSSRADKPFVAINCGAIPRELLGSELFGYSEGAFTGARRGGNIGKFEIADRGTLFLDEIGEMPLDMQTALLRILEERCLMRLGGRELITVDVRIISASNKDLKKQVELGRFREDLYYRLNVINIKLLPLRERRGDVSLLVDYLLKKLCRRLGKPVPDLSPEVSNALQAYHWPGNIRELQNILEGMANGTNLDYISKDLLPAELQVLVSGTRVSGKEDLKGAEEIIIRACLEECGWNKSLSAQKLGISRSTLYRRLKQLG